MYSKSEDISLCSYMFNGDLSLENSKFISFIIIFCGFMSIVVDLAQDGNFDIHEFYILQTFFCWPSIIEDFIISFILWSFRYIERLIGEKTMICFLLNNLITFLPIFCVTIYIYGIKRHFSFLFFIPCSLFIFMLWRIPSTPFFKVPKLSDKIIVTILFSIEVIMQFPLSALSLISSICGYIFWVNDSFKIKRILTNLNFDDHD